MKQALILGWLVLILFGLLAVAGYLLTSSSGLAAMFATATLPQPTATPTLVPPTKTPNHTPTALATSTRAPLSGSSIIPDGWNRFSDSRVEIWLPPSWDGGLPATEWTDIIDRMKQVNEYFSNTAEKMRNEPRLCDIWAYNTDAPDNLTMIEMDLVWRPEPITDLNAYVDAWNAGLPADTAVIEDRPFELRTYQARRVVYQWSSTDITWIYVAYWVLDGTTLYDIRFYSDINVYFQIFPEFDRIARTFKVLP
jgi:hypothetical protein